MIADLAIQWLYELKPYVHEFAPYKMKQALTFDIGFS